ncbi:hypothetical protein OCGS_2100 [Oceaniovalibus guishaninsula JLT2003]|uniref:Uncharacterized protein n=1 Tax=Oceaniovalibus guishaninsula JLT2003 TaxID=1231392 RepID=K2GM12_9RHOB|nr:hypothetical protein OCGS_2100 [Oceaniovalibus guishaninsula JLT2003]
MVKRNTIAQDFHAARCRQIIGGRYPPCCPTDRGIGFLRLRKR